MAVQPKPARIALVVHPTRMIDATLEKLRRFAGEHGLELVQVHALGASEREVAPVGELEQGDLLVAVGGDGTVLSAMRAAARKEVPVLGVACGSLGALTAVPAEEVDGALERALGGDWTPRPVPALAIYPSHGAHHWAINDFVAVRRGAGQLVADVSVDDELYARIAGDGVIVATPLGSSAYSMAAGGPVLVMGTHAVVCTPVAMHGGSAPPVVVPATSTVRVEVHPSFAGFDVEIDGHRRRLDSLDYSLTLHEDKVTLVSFGEPGPGIAGLRARRLITDSPRVLARDDRDARQPDRSPSA